jgi:hypothetical protein
MYSRNCSGEALGDAVTSSWCKRLVGTAKNREGQVIGGPGWLDSWGQCTAVGHAASTGSLMRSGATIPEGWSELIRSGFLSSRRVSSRWPNEFSMWRRATASYWSMSVFAGRSTRPTVTASRQAERYKAAGVPMFAQLDELMALVPRRSFSSRSGSHWAPISRRGREAPHRRCCLSHSWRRQRGSPRHRPSTDTSASVETRSGHSRRVFSRKPGAGTSEAYRARVARSATS